VPSDAFAAVVSALARTDLSTAELDRRLARSGFDEPARQHALDRALAAGYLDDARVARERARRLADRGSADAAIRLDLERRGLSPELVEDAVAALPDERERAEQVAARLGGGVRAARALVRKGFADDVVERTIRLHIAEDA
jgi:SOS response regulatory protein OraA/RecX